MKIIVTSDTHIKSTSKKQFPQKLLEACQTADLIIHAGDWSSPEVHTALSSIAPVKGVYGNVDGEDIQTIVPEKEIIEVGGYTIGIVHGHGEKKTTEQRARDAFASNDLDVLIFGHSHIPFMRYAGKTLLLNPGSPTDKRKLPYYSFALLELGKTIECKIIFF